MQHLKVYKEVLIFQIITSQYTVQCIIDFVKTNVYAIMFLVLDKGKPNEYSIQSYSFCHLLGYHIYNCFYTVNIET